MGTLLLKLAGPLQAWGDASRYNERKTRHEPTKSGIVGLLASSLGRSREDSVEDLAALRVGVRIDQPGTLVKDFQTAHRRVFDATLSTWVMSDAGKNAYLTSRYCLSDAVFVAGIEVPDEELSFYADALTHPAFPLFLGRRSCPPACKILFGVQASMGLEQALRKVPWQATSRDLIRRHQRDQFVSLGTDFDIISDHDEEVVLYDNVCDVPISFSQRYRQYEWRRVMRKMLNVPNPHYVQEMGEHDPFAALQEVD